MLHKKKAIILKLIILNQFIFIFFIGNSIAKVTGVCSNCHTMHDSQNGTIVENKVPHKALLIKNCIGCHSSTEASTIVSLKGTQIPIVYNTQPPIAPLAGGNFYWMVHGSGSQAEKDARGHNVRGISNKDKVLSWAPGSPGCTSSCHESLTLTDEATHQNMKNGCQGCHNSVNHHANDPKDTPVSADGGWYRFLSAPSTHDSLGGAGVHGIEDANWEQNADKDNHNIYYGGNGTDGESPQSIGKFCAGCHYNFHSPGFASTKWGVDNGGGDNPWLRHPTDAEIPNIGEFAATINSDYDPTVPVGKPNIGKGNFIANKVEEYDKVICISCHRAHGSPYADLLRWDYSGMLIGTKGSSSGSGCFKCHSSKDGN